MSTQTNIDTLRVRSKIIRGIRDFLDSEGFWEVETPLLLAHPDLEPTIQLFQTSWIFQDQSRIGYLAPSPEFQMKKLLAAGSGSIYQVCKSFRNEEPSSDLHNPEFTILEWYRVGADYQVLMNDCENLITSLLQTLSIKKDSLSRGKAQIDLTTPWERLSVLEAFERYAEISEHEFFDTESLRLRAREKGYAVDDTTSYDDLFYLIMLNEIEPHIGLNKPTFLYDYPSSQAALARKKPDDPRLAERFELYIGGLEIANAFSELVDWREQEERLQSQRAYRKSHDLPYWDVDEQFIAALKTGMPATAGIALGVDRLVMLLTGAESLQDVLTFSAGDIFRRTKVVRLEECK